MYHGWHLTGNGGVWFKDSIEKSTKKYFLAKTRLKDCSKSIEEEKPYYEVGAVQDIQGFDLEYAGVIIGESWKYINNKVKIDLSNVAGKNYRNDGIEESREKKDKDISKEVKELWLKREKKKKAISNELGVLLSRGKKGIVIYAVNAELRSKLIEATQNPICKSKET